MTTTYQVPAENALTGEKTTVNLTIENSVLAAIEAARKTDGTIDEDVYCLRLTGFTKSQLDAAFAKVQNKAHWKNPIDAVVPNTELLLTINAINHFHGSSDVKTSVVEIKDGVAMIRVQNAGYAC